MRPGTRATLAALSAAPVLAAGVAWWWLAEDFVRSHPVYTAFGWGFTAAPPPQQRIDVAHWALNLLPPITFLLPILPVVLTGRELGRRHLEDYDVGLAGLGLTMCAAALVIGVAFDLAYTPHGRKPGRAEATGFVVAVGAPVLAGLGLALFGARSAARRRRDRERRRNWQCPSCGYSLRGNPWQCPECGRRYVPLGQPPGLGPGR